MTDPAEKVARVLLAIGSHGLTQWESATRDVKTAYSQYAQAAITAHEATLREQGRLVDAVKIVADGPPCPTCGFKITSRPAPPFVFDGDDDSLPAPPTGTPE